MNKLIWSAFAMSLNIIVPVWGQEALLRDFDEFKIEISPELTGPQHFTPLDLHQEPDWQLKKADLILDKAPLKGQDYSLIPWDTLDPEKWMDVDQWLHEIEVKSKHPDWKLRLRDNRQLELVGKILSCRGECPVFRGTMPASGQFLSRLLEGDEIRTEKDSVAWIFLMDGTLVRLGSESSLSLQEINLGEKEIFILARLNHGHVYWHQRTKGEFPLEFAPETDAFSLPLNILQANRQHFERKIFQSQNDRERLAEVMDLYEGPIKEQVKQINEFKTVHDELLKTPSRVMLVAPNVTLVATGLSFDLVYVTGGSSYLKKRGDEKEELTVQLRGYSQVEPLIIRENEWHEVAPKGRSMLKISEVPATLQLVELLTKRIKTMELAREIWISQFTLPILSAMKKPKVLAIEFGYSLWGDEIKRRFEYLTEYTRRIETTNIRSIDNLLTKIKASGRPVERELTAGLYQHALNHYLKSLKTRYTQKQMQVREMNDLQYYVWTLKNGKI